MQEYYAITYSNSLSHHGVKGMKWGVRKQRLVSGIRRFRKKPMFGSRNSHFADAGRAINRTKNSVKTKLKDPETKRKIKKAAKIGAGIAIAGLAVYGAYRIANSKNRFEYYRALSLNALNQADKWNSYTQDNSARSHFGNDSPFSLNGRQQETNWRHASDNYRSVADRTLYGRYSRMRGRNY